MFAPKRGEEAEGVPEDLKSWGRVWGKLGMAPRPPPSKQANKQNRKINNSGENRKTTNK